MTTGRDMTCHCRSTFPLEEPQLIVLYVWSVICLSAFWVADVTSPFLQTAGSLSPHRVEYKVHSVNVCWTAVTMAWNGNLVYKGHSDTPLRNLPLLCSLKRSKMATFQSIGWEILHNPEEKHTAFYHTTWCRQNSLVLKAPCLGNSLAVQ